MSDMRRVLYTNAAILTEDPACPHADAMLVDGERIAWIGALDDAPRQAAAIADEVVDLGHARVIPGFVDAHMHAVMLANYSPQISALPPTVTSIEDLVQAVHDRRAQQGPDAWVEGWGYDEGLLAEHRSPTRWDLDRGCADAPVCIMRTCQHIRCVNSKALEIAGITRDTPDPVGGEIERDASGEPTGVLKETARDLVTPFIPHANEADAVRNLTALGELLASQGVVAATDMCSMDGTDTYALLSRAAEQGFAQDCAVYILWDQLKGDPVAAFPVEQTAHAAQVFKAGVKLLADGSVSGRTAWFAEPYLPASGDLGRLVYGIPTCTEEDLEDAVAFCRSAGLQLSVHAMGTKAIDRALAHVTAGGPWLSGDAPSARLEHVTAPSRQAVELFARSGVGVVTQPIFAYCEIGSYLKNLGAERTKRSYPLRTLIDAGARLCISTDAPATSWARPSDPFPNIKAAVTRRAYDGTDCGAGEALTVEEALALYTREAARMVGFEGLGMLKAGYKASFVLLDRDILNVPAAELDQVRVSATYIRGRKVFEAH